MIGVGGAVVNLGRARAGADRARGAAAADSTAFSVQFRS